jgi:hypothetical protein
MSVVGLLVIKPMSQAESFSALNGPFRDVRLTPVNRHR